jgi:signal transduction histidine kinase
MHRLSRLTLSLVCAIVTMAAAECAQGQSQAGGIDALRERLDEIDAQLEALASFSLQTSVGPIGWRSTMHSDADHSEWIKVELGSEQDIDLIALVPALSRGSYNSFIADGFPVSFSVFAGSADEPEGKLIASYDEQDDILPRIAPLTIACPGTRASWIKVVATKLGTLAWNREKVLQLAEIMVFRGKENVALGCSVSTSSQGDLHKGARQRAFLVDGSLPYLMHAPGNKSTAYFVRVESGDSLSFTADLGEVIPVNGLQLHGIEVSDTVPQANRANFAFPRHLVLEGGEMADFSDASLLCEYKQKSMYDVSSIVCRRFAERACRYLRLTVLEGDHVDTDEIGSVADMLGFAEIEVLSNGSNVLAGCELRAGFEPILVHKTSAQLTDGANVFGKIINTRDWIEQLAKRHDLETERPMKQASLNRLFAKQKEHLAILRNLSVLVGGFLVIIILLSHIIRTRQLTNMRQRLAADLHDQVGANLHAIGLLSDIAREEASQTASGEEAASVIGVIREIRDTTDRTADSVRHCSATLEPHTPLLDFEEDMRRIALRMMEGYDCRITVEGEDHIAKLKPLRRADLFLFYKECLVNISRHARATSFQANLKADQRKLTMTITDNGRGISDDPIPPSIQRRAKMLRGKLKIESPVGDTGHGTRIILEMPVRTLLPFI